MSTNFYYHPKPPCEHCLRPYDPIFIGKRARGWKFMLHAEYRGQEWRDIKDSLLIAYRIEDENGAKYSAEEMIAEVEGWQSGRSHAAEFPEDAWHDSEGYVMCGGEWN